MSTSHSKAIAKRSSSTALMAPPPAPKRIKRPTIVLDEDTYTSAISHIIRRDYFPGLAETDAQREYLSALDSKDNGWIREAGKKLTEVMTPVPGRSSARARATRFAHSGDGGATPSVWGADTPRTEVGEDVESAEDDDGLGKLDDVDLNMGLGAFQAKYTSEDQESFNQILDRANAKRFEKNAWIHDGNRYASKQRMAQQKVLQEKAQAQAQAQAQASSSTSTALVPIQPTQTLSDDRPAAPNTHKHTAFNTLMFAPQGIESWAPSTRYDTAQAASLAPPKRVNAAATRLPLNEAPSAAAKRPSSPTLSAVRDALAGNPRLSASEGGFGGAETPRVNGYAFVDAAPPSPEDEGPAPTDLLERFGARASSAAAFSMADASARERLHGRMVERIAVSRRAGAEGAGGGGGGAPSTSVAGRGLGIFRSEGAAGKTPRFVSAPTPAMVKAQAQAQAQGGMTPGRKAGALTPAARRLLERVGGKTPVGGGNGGFGGKEGRQWTPTPKGVGRK